MTQGSKTFRRHSQTLRDGVVGESFIRGVTRAANNADRRTRGYSASRTYSGMRPDEVHTLIVEIARTQPRIEPKQSAKGLAWLRTPKVWRLLSKRQRDIVDHFDHFTLADLFDAGDAVAFMVPVYTVHAKDGRTFTYRVGSWQSGIPFTIMEG